MRRFSGRSTYLDSLVREVVAGLAAAGYVVDGLNQLVRIFYAQNNYAAREVLAPNPAPKGAGVVVAGFPNIEPPNNDDVGAGADVVAAGALNPNDGAANVGAAG